jgi:putative nucleotidyltransferase with HDIG domain
MKKRNRTVKQRRPITAELRASVIEDLPEINDIKDADLRAKAIEAWAYSLAGSSFARIRDIPGEGNPGHMALRRGTQATHLRGVAGLALRILDEFQQSFPEIEVDRDVVLAGALCHDVGKPYEFDPENLARWKADPSGAGQPTLRHSVYGAHVCLAVGLPEELAHIALGHSLEGQHIGLSTECMIVRFADHTWWMIAGSLGLLKPESMGQTVPMMRARSLDMPAEVGKAKVA